MELIYFFSGAILGAAIGIGYTGILFYNEITDLRIANDKLLIDLRHRGKK